MPVEDELVARSAKRSEVRGIDRGEAVERLAEKVACFGRFAGAARSLYQR